MYIGIQLFAAFDINDHQFSLEILAKKIDLPSWNTLYLNFSFQSFATGYRKWMFFYYVKLKLGASLGSVLDPFFSRYTLPLEDNLRELEKTIVFAHMIPFLNLYPVRPSVKGSLMIF